MTAVLFVILIVSQLICFYFIVLQHTKLAKFKNLKKRQDQLIREMDDAISLYLVEMKEENERFIRELSSLEQRKYIYAEQQLRTAKKDETKTKTFETESPLEVEEHEKMEPQVMIPKTMAVNAYKQQGTMHKDASVQRVQESEPKEEKDSSGIPSFEQEVLALYREGKTIDEIAKIMQRGKTEVELLIKFLA